MRVSVWTFLVLLLSWFGAIICLLTGHTDWAVGCLIVNIAFSRTAEQKRRHQL